MKKKGVQWLTEKTLNIIIAVICIVGLIALVTYLYNNSVKSNKLSQAEENLERIEEVINVIEEGNITIQNIPNPIGWSVYSFAGNEKPNSCAGENCVCICDNAILSSTSARIKKCNNKGSCLIVSNLETDELYIKIDKGGLTFLGIKKQGGNIYLGELNEY